MLAILLISMVLLAICTIQKNKNESFSDDDCWSDNAFLFYSPYLNEYCF